MAKKRCLYCGKWFDQPPPSEWGYVRYGCLECEARKAPPPTEAELAAEE
mgnify:CR=1